jgi:ADP-heptose:LPS heptosyltransferase
MTDSNVCPTMRILIVKSGNIGNIVQALPASAVTREAMPRTEIFWGGEPGLVKIFRDNPLLDRLIEVVTKALGRGLVSGETLRAPRQQLRQLRASAFDLTLDFQLSLRSPSIARPSGALRIFGFLRDSLRERIRRILLSKSFSVSINPYTIRKNLSRAHEALGITVPQDLSEILSGAGIPRGTADSPARVVAPAIAWS